MQDDISYHARRMLKDALKVDPTPLKVPPSDRETADELVFVGFANACELPQNRRGGPTNQGQILEITKAGREYLEASLE